MSVEIVQPIPFGPQANFSPRELEFIAVAPWIARRFLEAELMTCWPGLALVPHWRWRRVELLRLLGEPARPKIEDEWTLRAFRFQNARAKLQIRPPKARGRKPWVDPDIAAAVEIWESADMALRWRIESALLARMPVPEVALRHGVPTAVIAAYEAMFLPIFSSGGSRRLPAAAGLG